MPSALIRAQNARSSAPLLSDILRLPGTKVRYEEKVIGPTVGTYLSEWNSRIVEIPLDHLLNTSFSPTYQAKVDPAKAGLPLTAFVQLRCALGSCLLRTTSSRSSPRWSRSTSSPATGARS